MGRGRGSGDNVGVGLLACRWILARSCMASWVPTWISMRHRWWVSLEVWWLLVAPIGLMVCVCVCVCVWLSLWFDGLCLYVCVCVCVCVVMGLDRWIGVSWVCVCV